MTSITSRDIAPETNSEGLSSWWTKFKSKPARKEADPPRSIFNVPLQESITYANVAISLYNDDGQTFIYGYIPIVVAKCGLYLKDNATETEGIFRLSGSAKRIKELQAIFDQPPKYGKGLDWDGFTVHDAANILRRYLNHLPDPIIPYDWYDAFREPLKENWTTNKTIKRMQELVASLPALNRQLLLYILDLLAVFASKSEINRMTSENLSAIFQPGLITHPRDDMAPQEYRLSQEVLVFLIDNQSHFLLDSLCSPDKAPTVDPSTQKKGSVSRSRTVQASKSGPSATQVAARQAVAAEQASNGKDSPSRTIHSSTNLSRSNTVPTKRLPPANSSEQGAKTRYVSTPLAQRIPVQNSVDMSIERQKIKNDLGAANSRKSSLDNARTLNSGGIEARDVARSPITMQSEVSTHHAPREKTQQSGSHLSNEPADNSASDNSSVLGGDSEFSIMSSRKAVPIPEEGVNAASSTMMTSSLRPVSMHVLPSDSASHSKQSRTSGSSPSKFSNLFKKKPRNQSVSSTSEAGGRRDLDK